MWLHIQICYHMSLSKMGLTTWDISFNWTLICSVAAYVVLITLSHSHNTSVLAVEFEQAIFSGRLFSFILCLVIQCVYIMARENQSNISSNIFSACLMKCWMKNYLFHMTNFLVCKRSSNIPSNIRTFIHS